MNHSNLPPIESESCDQNFNSINPNYQHAFINKKLMKLSTFSAKKPLLLIVDYPADTAGGGAVILRSLLRGQEREKVIWISLSGSTISNPTLWDGHLRLNQGSAGIMSPERRSIFWDSTWFAQRLASEIQDIAREREAGGLWVVMHGAAVHVAAHLARNCHLPMHITVHDDPTSYVMRSKRRFMLAPLVERDFAFSLKKARSIDVVCEGMAQQYQSRYGVNCVIVHRGIDKGVEPGTTYDKSRLGLSIGMLGNTYSYEQLPILCQAIIEASKRIGVQGRVVIVGQGFGERLRRQFCGKLEIEVTDYLNETQAIERLRECFLLYLNYPFSRRCRVLRQTSFPTKLSSYVMTSRPILMHVPDDSSVMPLAKNLGYITPWNTMEALDGTRILMKYWSDFETQETFHTHAERIRQQYYDLASNRETLFRALNSLA